MDLVSEDEVQLRELNDLPDGLLGLDATALHDALGGPTLIHLQGQRQPALFVSVLLHGNETTGWEAVRTWLAGYEPGGGERPLPRQVSLFIGNTAAAAQGLRRLDGQPDFNRVWPGGDHTGTPEGELIRSVVERMARRRVFASVDVHNNTGLNPHYACINRLEPAFLHLAALFGRTVIYFVTPRGVQSMAMSELCPAVTLECGKVGQAHGVEHAVQYLDACAHLAEFPAHPVAGQDIDLYHTVAVAKVPPAITLGFGDAGQQVNFVSDLDRLNFRELPAATELAALSDIDTAPLVVQDEQGRDVTARYFDWQADSLRTRIALMPSMLTKDERVIRQDCLCYIMERYGHGLPEG